MVAGLALVGLVAARGRVPHEQFRETYVRARANARRGRRRVGRLAGRVAYASRIKRAHEQWDSGHHELALELIEDAPAGQRGFEWSYLDRLYHRDFATLRGHDRWARKLALAPDGLSLASGDEGGTILVWDLPARRERARFRGPEGPVQALAFAPDGGDPRRVDRGAPGRLAKSGDALGRGRRPGPRRADPLPGPGLRGRIRARRPGAGRHRAGRAGPGPVSPRRVVGRGATGRVGVEPLGEGGPVAFSPDGLRVAWAGARGEATLVDLRSGRVAWKSGHPGDARTRLAFSPDGLWLASAGPGVVRWRESATGREVASHAVNGDFYSLAFSPDGRTLACELEPLAFSCWDARTGRPRPTAVAADDLGGAFAFRRDGRAVAAGRMGPPVPEFDLDSGRPGERFPFGVKTAGVSDLVFTRDDRTLVIAYEGRRLRLWHVEPNPAPPEVPGHAAETWSLAFSPDGRSLASGSDDETIRLWDRATGREIARVADRDGTVASLSFAEDGTRLAFARLGQEGAVGIWDVAGRRVVWTSPAHRGGARAVAISPDGRTLASAGSDWVVRLWDAETGRALAAFEGHAKSIRAVAFAPDGLTLASAGNDGTIRAWDLGVRRRHRVLAGADQYAAIAFAPDGRRLAAANEDGNVEVWGVAEGGVAQDLLGHKTGARAVAYSPDGRTIATGGEDATVRLWDATTGQEFLTLPGHKRAVIAVAFDPSGRVLASGSFDGAITLWHGHD